MTCARKHGCEQEFEHIQRKAFGIACAPECNICCMVAMSANKTTESPERLSPEGPGEGGAALPGGTGPEGAGGARPRGGSGPGSVGSGLVAGKSTTCCGGGDSCGCPLGGAVLACAGGACICSDCSGFPGSMASGLSAVGALGAACSQKKGVRTCLLRPSWVSTPGIHCLQTPHNTRDGGRASAGVGVRAVCLGEAPRLI